MVDLLQTLQAPWLPPLIGVGLLLLSWALFRLVRGKAESLESAIAEISFDRIEGLIIPSADEGEILIDYLLLTSEGLLILEVNDAQGIVFGGNKLQDWTVINNNRRYTFSNPQPALYDRIAAVREIVRQVPVAGRILFLDGAQFTKGVPDLATGVADLVTDFGESDKSAANPKIEAFKPYWDLIRKAALTSDST